MKKYIYTKKCHVLAKCVKFCVLYFTYPKLLLNLLSEKEDFVNPNTNMDKIKNYLYHLNYIHSKPLFKTINPKTPNNKINANCHFVKILFL